MVAEFEEARWGVRELGKGRLRDGGTKCRKSVRSKRDSSLNCVWVWIYVTRGWRGETRRPRDGGI